MALAIDRKTLPPYAFEIARDLNNLAELYDNQGKYADAEEAFKRALEIAEKVYGSEHPIVSTSLNNLAAVEVDQNKYKDAEPLYRRSLGIEEKMFGPEHPDLARTTTMVRIFRITGALSFWWAADDYVCAPSTSEGFSTTSGMIPFSAVFRFVKRNEDIQNERVSSFS